MEEVEGLRKSQVELKKQIAELQNAISQKKQLVGYDRERELEDMVKVALRQNKKVADKVDYLMDTLIEASQSEGEGTVEKSLSALSTSQLELMKQIDVLRQKVENAETVKQLMKAQQESIAVLDKKLVDLGAAVSSLPYSQQIEAVKKEIDGLNAEVKSLETSVLKAPEQVTSSLELVKADVGELKSKLDSISSEISNVEKDETELNTKMAVIDAVNLKIQSVESKIETFEELIRSGEPQREEFFKQEIAKIEADLSAIDELKKKVDEITNMNAQERDKAIEIMNELKKLEDDVAKLVRTMETYPNDEINDASFLKEKFNEISAQVLSLKQDDVREPLKEQTAELKKQIDEIASRVGEGTDFKKKEQALTELSDKLKQLESDVRSAKENPELQNEFKSFHEEIDALSEKLKSSEKATSEIRSVEKRVKNIESFLTDTKIAAPSEIDEMTRHVSEARSAVKEAKQPVSLQRVSNLNYLIDEIELPEVSADNSLPEAKQKLEDASSLAEGKEKEKIEALSDRVEYASKQSIKQEREALMTKMKTREIKEEAQKLEVNVNSVVRDYVRNLSLGAEITVDDLAKQLNVSNDAALKAVKQAETEKLVDLKNASYLARLSGKKASFSRAQ
ncbi:hypothetical protein H0N95_02935 [Candidatus Micrarchaeota archaeon]|nr:hypothetical protein [Candidatus Micrarchaeota archaeon]